MTTPSKGAMRAAEEIDSCFANGVGTSNEDLAHIIDRETNGPLMLEAIKKAARSLRHHPSCLAVMVYEEPVNESNCDCAIKDLHAAIAAAENGDSQ